MRKFAIIILALTAMMFFLLLLAALGFGDIDQYKRIGKTNFYLMESMGITKDGRTIPTLRYSLNSNIGGYAGAGVLGVPKHIFWNDSILVVKCSDKLDGKITNYCIIKMFKTENCEPWEEYELNQYATSMEYVQAMNAMGLKESEMRYTDNSIPWSLHLFD